MKRVVLDVNVVLDVLLDRKPHAEASASVWAAVETRAVEGVLAAHAVTTVYNLIRKELGTAKAKRVLAGILKVFGVAPVDGAVLTEAMQLACPDFEDAVTAAAARHAGCQYVVTRDPKGFRGSPVLPLTPEAVAPLLGRG